MFSQKPDVFRILFCGSVSRCENVTRFFFDESRFASAYVQIPTRPDHHDIIHESSKLLGSPSEIQEFSLS